MPVTKNSSLIRQLPYIIEPSTEEMKTPSPPDKITAAASASMSLVLEATSSSNSSIRIGLILFSHYWAVSFLNITQVLYR